VDRWIWKSIADDLRRQAIPHIRGEQRPEVSNMRIVREPAQFDARNAKICDSEKKASKNFQNVRQQIIRDRCKFRLQTKHGAFSLAACGDPVFRVQTGSGRLVAKGSLHSGSGDQAGSWSD